MIFHWFHRLNRRWRYQKTEIAVAAICWAVLAAIIVFFGLPQWAHWPEERARHWRYIREYWGF